MVPFNPTDRRVEVLDIVRGGGKSDIDPRLVGDSSPPVPDPIAVAAVAVAGLPNRGIALPRITLDRL